MIKIDSVVKYSDVKTGVLSIMVGDKVKKYRALWFSYLAGVVNGQNTFPAGIYKVRFKPHDGNVNTPFVYFNRLFGAPIKPLGKTTYAQMMPYIYLTHTDGTEISKDEWRQVTNIMAFYVTKFTLEPDVVDMTPKEFMNKAQEYDLENW